MKSAVLPLAAGIFGVVALFYIYYRDKDKKKKTTSDDNNGMSSSTPVLPNDTVETLEFKVSNVQVPLIVGRNSVTLKQIEDKTSTNIRFRESDEDNQICTIKGKANNVKIAKELVDIEGSKPSVITEELMVSTSSCGKIEGYGGTVLHEICQKSSAKIWIDPGMRKVQGETRRVLITGTKEQVDLAKKLIDEKSKEPATPPQLEPIDDQKKSPRPSPHASNSSITTTEIPREILLPSPEKLKTNDTQLEVFVSAVSSPSRFWVQLCGPQSTELDFLVDAMTEYYNLKENQELHKIREPYLGQIVAANFLADSKWYRAEIVAIQPNDVVKDDLVFDVYFLDYGDQQFVSRKDILELRADFLSLRFQAIECFLAHIQPLQTGSKFEEWDEKAIGAFEEMVQVSQWKKLISKVVTYKDRKSFALQRHNQRESSPVPGVQLYEENSEKSIALELVKQGHAELSDRFGDITKSSVLTVVEDEPVVEEKLNEISKPEEPSKNKEKEEEVTQSELEEDLKEDPQKSEILPSNEIDSTSPPLPVTSVPSELLIKSEISEPKEEAEDLSPPQPQQPVSNQLEPTTTTTTVTNGNSDVFGGGSNAKPKKKKKQQMTADFLSMEQKQNGPPKKKGSQDWNAMMEE